MKHITRFQLISLGLLLIIFGKLGFDYLHPKEAFVILAVLGVLICNFGLNLIILQSDNVFFLGVRTVGSMKLLKYVLIAMILPYPLRSLFRDYVKAKNDPFTD